MVIFERKTGKESMIAINGSTKKGLLTYMDTLDSVKKVTIYLQEDTKEHILAVRRRSES